MSAALGLIWDHSSVTRASSHSHLILVHLRYGFAKRLILIYKFVIPHVVSRESKYRKFVFIIVASTKKIVSA